jgi:hypothetical protein
MHLRLFQFFERRFCAHCEMDDGSRLKSQQRLSTVRDALRQKLATAIADFVASMEMRAH